MAKLPPEVGEMPGDDTPNPKLQTCPHCEAEIDRLAVQCPECGETLPIMGGSRRSSRGRRYVYGKRKAHLSQEVIWLLIFIVLGLLFVFGVQVVAFMRSKKLMQAPPSPLQQRYCEAVRSAPRFFPPSRVTQTVAQGLRHEDRLRYLRHAGCPTGGSDPRLGRLRLSGYRDLRRYTA